MEVGNNYTEKHVYTSNPQQLLLVISL